MVGTLSPCRLEIHEPGSLDELSLRSGERRAPGAGEVEIEVCAVGLNFRDVMKALGIYPVKSGKVIEFGEECAGHIVAVGPGVDEFRVGDEVIAIAPGCFASSITTPTTLVMPKPAQLTFEQALTIPIAYLTAYYALAKVARIRPGESVLIQCAAGGVGLAAVQIAQLFDARLFATASRPEKRQFLQSIGVHHVMNSRSLGFVDEIRRITHGRGVDVVLNSLAGEYIQAGLSVLDVGGRFVEIGKVDVYENSQLGLGAFRNSLSFSFVDLDVIVRRRPELGRHCLEEVLQFINEGKLTPLPYRAFALADVAEAFRFMRQAKHIGKIIISFPC